MMNFPKPDFKKVSTFLLAHKHKFIYLFMFAGVGILIKYSIPVPKTVNPIDENNLITNVTSSSEPSGEVLGKFDCYKNDAYMPGVKKKSAPPKAFYYKEPKEIELQDCQTEWIDDSKFIESHKHQLYRKCDPKKIYYTGQYMITAEIDPFPDLEHWGNAGPKVTLDDNMGENNNVFGTLLNPSEPICSYLARMTGNPNLNTAREYNGKIMLYSFKGQKFHYSMPKLGSGISCLNLITLIDNSNSFSLFVKDDLPAFNYTNLKDETKHVFDLIGKESMRKTMEVTVADRISEFFGSINKYLLAVIDMFKRFFDPNSTMYTRQNLPGEPTVNYEILSHEEAFCKKSNSMTNGSYNGPEIRNINLVSEEPTESMHGLEQIIYARWLPWSVPEYCDSNGSPGVTVYKNGKRIPYTGPKYWGAPPELPYFCDCIKPVYKCIDLDSDNNKYVNCDGVKRGKGRRLYCDQWKMKKNPPYQNMHDGEGGDFDEIKMEVHYDKLPKTIGLPGAMSGVGRLYQYLQVRAKMVNHDLVAPLNGTRTAVTTRYYDPFAYVWGDGFPDEGKIQQYTEFDPKEGYIPYQDPLKRDIYMHSEYKAGFILPFDIEPYIRALEYNYNFDEGSQDYQFDENALINEKFDINDPPLEEETK